jgi:lysophospholipase L1-like esterase
MGLARGRRGEPLIRRIAFLGDSVTAACSGYQTYADPIAGPGHTERSFVNWANSLLGVRFSTVPNPYGFYGTANPFLTFGWSGITALGFVTSNVNALSSGANQYPGVTKTPLDVAIESAPDAFFVYLGINDVVGNTSAAVLTRLSNVITPLRAAGKPVYVGTLLPHTDSDRQAIIDGVNSGLVTLCPQLGAILVPWHSELMTDGLQNTTYFLADGTGYHPNAAGTFILGRYLAGLWTSRIPAAYSIPADGSARWCTANPFLTASAAGKGTDYFVEWNTGAETIYTDATGRNWQSVAISTDPDSTTAVCDIWCPEMTQTRIDALIASQVPVRGVVRYEIVSGHVRNIGLTYLGKNAANAVVRQAICGNTALTTSTGPFPPHTGILLTEKFTLPSGLLTVSRKSELSLYVRGGGLIRCTSMGIFEDP